MRFLTGFTTALGLAWIAWLAWPVAIVLGLMLAWYLRKQKA
jgi:hypothetical protein